MTSIRVVVADDQPLLRAAIVDLLSTDPRIDVIGTAGNAQEAIAQCLALAPDVVLMDVKMPGGGGLTATRVIRQSHPDTRVVAFSAHQDRSTVDEMLNAGAAGYLTKGAPQLRSSPPSTTPPNALRFLPVVALSLGLVERPGGPAWERSQTWNEPPAGEPGGRQG